MNGGNFLLCHTLHTLSFRNNWGKKLASFYKSSTWNLGRGFALAIGRTWKWRLLALQPVLQSCWVTTADLWKKWQSCRCWHGGNPKNNVRVITLQVVQAYPAPWVLWNTTDGNQLKSCVITATKTDRTLRPSLCDNWNTSGCTTLPPGAVLESFLHFLSYNTNCPHLVLLPNLPAFSVAKHGRGSPGGKITMGDRA